MSHAQRDCEHAPVAAAADQYFRIWLVHRPAGWSGPFNARPPRSIAIAPSYEHAMPRPLALAILADFNLDAQRGLDDCWLVMQPVRLIYGGDLVAREFID
jgi:hypothetical protein